MTMMDQQSYTVPCIIKVLAVFIFGDGENKVMKYQGEVKKDLKHSLKPASEVKALLRPQEGISDHERTARYRKGARLNTQLIKGILNSINKRYSQFMQTNPSNRSVAVKTSP